MLEFNQLNDRKILSIAGEEKFKFLQGLITNDVYKVTENQVIYALLLTPQGKYYADLIIALINDQLLLDIPADKIDSLMQKLNFYKLRSSVIISDISNDYTIYSITGNYENQFQSIKNEGQAISLSNNSIMFVDPRKSQLGLRCFIHSSNTLFLDNLNNQATITYDELRINLVVPEGDKDLITEKSFPLEFGLEKFNAIDFKKGCYVGQEVISRTWYQGIIRKQIFKIYGTKKLPQWGSEIFVDDKKIGIVCSSFNHKGLALIRLEDLQATTNYCSKAYCSDIEITIL